MNMGMVGFIFEIREEKARGGTGLVVPWAHISLRCLSIAVFELLWFILGIA